MITFLAWCALPLLTFMVMLAMIWFFPAEELPPETDPGDLESRAVYEQRVRRMSRDWRKAVKDKRDERKRLAEEKRQENWLIVRRNFPLWLADLGDAFSAHDYDTCYELARYICLALIYANHHLDGRFSVRALHRHAADIGEVENRRLHTREFFEALGRALEAQDLLIPNQGSRGRRVRREAFDWLMPKLPSSIANELLGW